MRTGQRPQKYRNYAGSKRGGRISRPVSFLVLLAALCMLMILIRGRIFVIREIEVTGNSVRSDSEIAGLTGLSLGMSIFNVNKEIVEWNLSANNYVELVEVRVDLPDTVQIEVRERTACAAVNCAGVIMLIDEEGYILERLTGVPQTGDLVVVSGMNASVSAQSRKIQSGTAGQVNLMRNLLSAIRTAGIGSMVSELNVSDPDNLYLISQSGIQVLLGDEGQLPEKLVWMQAVLEQLTRDGIMHGVVDVSSGKNAVYADR